MALEPTTPPPASQASLYVGDLPLDVTESVLFEAFKDFPSLDSVRVIRDSHSDRPLCYGYVNFLSHKDAIRAIELKNHSTLNGKPVRVMWSIRDSDARRSGVGNVFVKNLSDSIDTSVKLQEMFQKFGKILSCKVVTSDDGKSKGYGFVQFEFEASAKSAIEELNGLTKGGKEMYVGKFVRRSGRDEYTNLYVKNLDPTVSEDVLEEKFSQYGKIMSLVISKDENGASRGFGFVNFDKPENAKCAAEALHGLQLGSKVLYVARAQKKSEREVKLRLQFEEKKKEQILKYQDSNVYVKNIDDDITDEELRKHFSQCGTITSIKIMRDDKGLSKGFGFVCFSTPEEANRAVYSFHGFVIRRKPLYVSIAQRKEDRQAQLQLIYAHRLPGFSGPPSPPVLSGGYSQLYYSSPGFIQQIPVPMYQPPSAMRPGWRANTIPNPSRPVFHPSPITMAPNNSRQGQRGRTNGHVPPQGRGGLTLLQGPPHSVASLKDLSSLLAAASLGQRKCILGERLHPLVSLHQRDLAAKITGMLLEMDNSELLVLLDSPESLAAKVEEAVLVLKKAKLSNQDNSHTSKATSGGLSNQVSNQDDSLPTSNNLVVATCGGLSNQDDSLHTSNYLAPNQDDSLPTSNNLVVATCGGLSNQDDSLHTSNYLAPTSERLSIQDDSHHTSNCHAVATSEGLSTNQDDSTSEGLSTNQDDDSLRTSNCPAVATDEGLSNQDDSLRTSNCPAVATDEGLSNQDDSLPTSNCPAVATDEGLSNQDDSLHTSNCPAAATSEELSNQDDSLHTSDCPAAAGGLSNQDDDSHTSNYLAADAASGGLSNQDDDSLHTSNYLAAAATSEVAVNLLDLQTHAKHNLRTLFPL